MNNRTLHFPNNAMLADFIVANSIRGLMVDSKEHSISGELSQALIADACKGYGAYFKHVFS